MKKMPLIARFPVRPELREGESVGGWCWRVYSDNGHDAPTAVRSALAAMRSLREVVPNGVLSQLVGFEQLSSFSTRENCLIDPWSTQRSPNWYRWSRGIRFCPLCIAEIKCHLSIWDLPLMTACALHGCQLTIKCLACHRLWSWSFLKNGWQCGCGRKIEDFPVASAPNCAVRFSRILSNASDALVPKVVKEASFDLVPISAVYRTRDVYEILAWLLKVRRTLTDGHYHVISKFWPMVPRDGARMVPGSWEMSLLAEFPLTIERKARQALRKLFKGSRLTLVDLESVVRWKNVEKMIEELKASCNPMARPVFSAIERVQREHQTGIRGHEKTIFNPRLNDAQRKEHVHELAVWLRHFSENTSGTGPEVRQEPQQLLDGQFRARSSLHKDLVISRLNAMFDAVHQGPPPDRLQKKTSTGTEEDGHAS